MAGLVLMMLALSSFFSTLGVVTVFKVFKVFKVSLVEAKMEGRGIFILSTFSSGLVGIIHVNKSSLPSPPSYIAI